MSKQRIKHTKSIIEPEGSKVCYVCGAIANVEEHHIFSGVANRKKSEENGLKVHLCYMHHRDSKQGVHGANWELNLKLKKDAQRKYELLHSHKEFMQQFGKNWL